MDRRMKNFNVLEVDRKIRVLRQQFTKKQHIEAEFPEKRGHGQFGDLRGAWQERGDGVFKGGNTPMPTMWRTWAR